MSSGWQAKAAEACAIRDRSLPQDTVFPKDELANLPLNVISIPASCGKLSSREIEITEQHDATELLELLRTRVLTAKDVLGAFRRRAAIAQYLTNCVTELLPEAVEAAEACDAYIEKHGRPVGPLHGLPVSVKEQFAVGGHRTNASLVAWVDNVSTEDCELVQTLKRLGAVVFARTQQPQILMHLETTSNIYGVCVSPFDRTRTAGGSSGGEAALIAMSATPLGFGGDIGGSIRSPASLNNVYGFKPTARLISSYGVVGILPGNDSIIGSLGPFTRSKRDLDMVLRAYSSCSPWIRDPALMHYTFDSINCFAGRRLRVGVLVDDGIVSPSPIIRQMLNYCTDKLKRSQSVELVPFSPFQHDTAWSILRSLYFEGCEDKILELVQSSGEPILPLTSWITETENKKSSSILDQQKAKAARDEYRQAYSNHWNASGIDVLLSPVGPDEAPAHNTSKYWTYTALWNVLDYPALSFPASSILNIEDCASKPVGLQLIGKRLMDNDLLAALAVVEDVLRTN